MFPTAYQVAYRVLGHVQAAEDVAAEALARAFLDWHKIKELPYREAWVLRVTTNLAVDILRRRPPEIVAPAAIAAPEDIVD
ncbi:MAG: sigma factor, partial [Actinomycetota bacterium]